MSIELKNKSFYYLKHKESGNETIAMLTLFFNTQNFSFVGSCEDLPIELLIQEYDLLGVVPDYIPIDKLCVNSETIDATGSLLCKDDCVVSCVDDWVDVADRLPDVLELGDGNFCIVIVRTINGLEGEATFGCSGFMGEGYDFWKPIRTIAGNVNTDDEITQWKIKKEKNSYA